MKNKFPYTDNIDLDILATSDKVADSVMNLEKIKIWEPSHNIPFIKHDWSPDCGRLAVGNQIKIRIPPWIFKAECVDIKNYEVKWKFTQGPLEGAEYWRVESLDSNRCRVIKYLEYEVPNIVNKIIWLLIARKLHDWASLKQLKGIKRLVEQS